MPSSRYMYFTKDGERLDCDTQLLPILQSRRDCDLSGRRYRASFSSRSSSRRHSDEVDIIRSKTVKYDKPSSSRSSSSGSSSSGSSSSSSASSSSSSSSTSASVIRDYSKYERIVVKDKRDGLDKVIYQDSEGRVVKVEYPDRDGSGKYTKEVVYVDGAKGKTDVKLVKYRYGHGRSKTVVY